MSNMNEHDCIEIIKKTSERIGYLDAMSITRRKIASLRQMMETLPADMRYSESSKGTLATLRILDYFIVHHEDEANA